MKHAVKFRSSALTQFQFSSKGKIQLPVCLAEEILIWLILGFPLHPGEEAAKGAASFPHRINLTGYDPSDTLRSLATEILCLEDDNYVP